MRRFVRFCKKSLNFFGAKKIKHIKNPDNFEDYRSWLGNNEKRKSKKELKYNPKISVIMPVYNVDLNWLKRAIESVENQTYSNWELCIVDDNSPNKELAVFLLSKQSEKIKVKINAHNYHISRTSNEALKLATGEFIALLDHDDELSISALEEVVAVLNENKELDLIYTDEDKLTLDERRVYPAFKQNWDMNLLQSFMYVGHLGVYRKKIIDEIGGFRIGFEGAQDYDLILRFTEKTQKIFHLPKILYHWRMIPGSTAVEVNSKDYAYDRGRLALEQTLARRGFSDVFVVEDPLIRGNYRINYPIKKCLVSLLIFCSGKRGNLKEIIERNVGKIGYENIEVIVITAASCIEDLNIKYISIGKGIKDSLKEAVAAAKGEHIIWIHENIEVNDSNCIEKMLMYSQRNDVAFVSGRIDSTKNQILYAGGFIDKHENDLKVFYPNVGDDSNSFGYLGRVRRTQSINLSSDRCFMVEKSLLTNLINATDIEDTVENQELFWIYLFLKAAEGTRKNIYVPFIGFISDDHYILKEKIISLPRLKKLDFYNSPFLEYKKGQINLI